MNCNKLASRYWGNIDDSGSLIFKYASEEGFDSLMGQENQKNQDNLSANIQIIYTVDDVGSVKMIKMIMVTGLKVNQIGL